MNYADLMDLSRAYTDRYDNEVENNLDNFIVLVEAQVNRLLKTREQSCRAYVNTVADKEYYSLPPDWAGMRDIRISDPSPTSGSFKTTHLSLLDPVLFDEKRNGPDDGGCYYCVISNQIQIYPVQDAGLTIEMVYFQRVPSLNSTNTTNWISDDHPDIYVAGMSAEISLFAKDYPAATGWSDRMAAAVDQLDNVDWVERWSGDPLQVRAG